jgi:hypothetical protein
MLDCLGVGVRGILDSGDICSFIYSERELECRVSVRGADLEEVFWTFLSDKILYKFSILLGDVWDFTFER